MTALRALHDDLIEALRDLAMLVAGPVPDEATLASVRYRLSRASSARRKGVTSLCEALEPRLPPAQAAGLRALRLDIAEQRVVSSRHVGAWTLRAILADWRGYCAASDRMRLDMAAQIERERTLLYPHLERVAAA